MTLIGWPSLPAQFQCGISHSTGRNANRGDRRCEKEFSVGHVSPLGQRGSLSTTHHLESRCYERVTCMLRINDTNYRHDFEAHMRTTYGP